MAFPVHPAVLVLYEDYLIERRGVAASAGCDFVLVNLFGPTAGRPMRKSTITDLFRRLSRAGNLERQIHPHMLRHTYGRTLAERGTDLVVIQALMGHAWLESTFRYIAPSQERMREAVDRLPSVLPRFEDTR